MRVESMSWRVASAVVVLLAVVLLVAPTLASAQRRVALVIGNAAYEEPGAKLANPVNDARAVAEVLEELDFDVLLRTDLDDTGMDNAALEFAGELSAGDVAVFYYAGHALELNDRRNYLVPVDLVPPDSRPDVSETYTRNRSFPADEVLEYMEGVGARTRIMILDACRDNPFERMRSLTRGGLGLMSPRGGLVAYAAQPGRPAADDGRYAQHLVAALQVPGLPASEVFTRVSEAVEAASGGGQLPMQQASGAVGRFVFRPAIAGTGLAVTAVPAVSGSVWYKELAIAGPIIEAEGADPLTIRLVPYPADPDSPFGYSYEWGYPVSVVDGNTNPWPEQNAHFHGYVEFYRGTTLLYRIDDVPRVGIAGVSFSPGSNVLSVYVSANVGGASTLDELTVVHYELASGLTEAVSYGEGAHAYDYLTCSETQRPWVSHSADEPTSSSMRFEPCRPRDDVDRRERFASTLRLFGSEVFDIDIADRPTLDCASCDPIPLGLVSDLLPASGLAFETQESARFEVVIVQHRAREHYDSFGLILARRKLPVAGQWKAVYGNTPFGAPRCCYELLSSFGFLDREEDELHISGAVCENTPCDAIVNLNRMTVQVLRP